MLSFFIFKIFHQKRNANAFEIPTMSAICCEVYLASVLLNFIYSLTILELLADLDLQDLGVLVTDPMPALNFQICLQTVKKGIKLLP